MSRAPVELLESYRKGLESELSLLDRLAGLAAAQLEASLSRDTLALELASSQREHVLSHLLELEDTLRPSRETLAREADGLQGHPLFDAVRALHRRAEARLDEIRARDSETRARLQETDAVRHSTAKALDTAETTLAAYRKVVSPVSAPSSIVSRHW